MVLCLDPTSPVTDPSLLMEIQRVLQSGGEYICAIERRNIDGVESLLPRYGYNDGTETVELTRGGERVPQLGQLSQLFENIVSVTQRPRYSFVFDVAGEEEGTEAKAMRQVSSRSDESGLWIGDDAKKESAEETGQRPGRWLGADERLCDRDGDPAAVDVLFCGDNHMLRPTLREVQMPYLGLVERLHQVISDLQIRQHPSQGTPSFDDVLDQSPTEHNSPSHDFSSRERTSEFRALNQRAEELGGRRRPAEQGRPYDFGADGGTTRDAQASYNASQIREQLDQMTNLYQQVRAEMEGLFVRTQKELVERDRYIEHLVETVHQWQHERSDSQEKPPAASNQFEAENTSIFTRPLSPDDDHSPAGDEEPSDEDSEISEPAEEEPSEQKAVALDLSTEDDSVEGSDATDADEPEESEKPEESEEPEESKEPEESEDTEDAAEEKAQKDAASTD